jgi:MGT family glycosyltransferase
MTTESRQYLFTMWEGGGTLPPELGVAHRLIDRGHRVHVVGDPTIADRAAAIGAGFSPWRRAPHRTSLDPDEDLFRDWEVGNPLTVLRNFRDRFMAGPADEFAADTLDVIEVLQPDTMVVDGMMLGTIIAAQAAQLPVVALMPNIWMIPTPGAPAVGPGFPPAKTPLGRGRDAAMRMVANRVFNRGLTALNAARAAHGLAPLESFWDQLLAVERILVLTSASFDFAAPLVPDNVSYVGPILDDPQWAERWNSPWSNHDDEPLVLVAFTSNFQGHGDHLRRVVDALTSLPVRAVVTLGQMLDSQEVASTDNVAVVRSAPHNTILEHASLVVTHCGHGTTLKTLAAGVPMVCLPMGRDQNDNAARVVFHGAGRRLSPKASTVEIRQAVQEVLSDGRYRTNARRLATAIADERRSVDLVAELEVPTRCDEAERSRRHGWAGSNQPLQPG